MFNLGLTEIIFLAAVALLVIGPKQLPEMARTLAKFINEFRRSAGEFTKPMNDIRSDIDNMKHEASSQIHGTVAEILNNAAKEEETKTDTTSVEGRQDDRPEQG